MSLREMGGSLRSGQLQPFCVGVTWKEETAVTKGVIDRKGWANSKTLTVDDGQLFEIGIIAEAVFAISYRIKFQKYFLIVNLI